MSPNLAYYHRKAADPVWRAKRAAINSAAQKKHYAKPENRADRIYRACRARAEKKGIEFALTVEWIAERIRAGVCEATGLPIRLDGVGRGPWSPSVDRVDSTKGYTPDNCQVTVWAFNAAKSDFTMDDLMAVARALVARHA